MWGKWELADSTREVLDPEYLDGRLDQVSRQMLERMSDSEILIKGRLNNGQLIHLLNCESRKGWRRRRVCKVEIGLRSNGVSSMGLCCLLFGAEMRLKKNPLVC